MSVSLLPGIIRAAIVSVKSVIAAWMTWTLVSRSDAIFVIATFVLVPAKLHRNCAMTSEDSARRATGAAVGAACCAMARAPVVVPVTVSSGGVGRAARCAGQR